MHFTPFVSMGFVKAHDAGISYTNVHDGSHYNTSNGNFVDKKT